MSSVDPALVRGVRLLSLDAGNTVIFLDHARLARLAGERGLATDAAALIRAEGEAKRALTDGALVDVEWSAKSAPGGRGWGRMTGTILHRAGLPRGEVGAMLDFVWPSHVAHNLWSLVPDGLGAALDAVRAQGIKVVLTSNSEGMLDRLFRELGIHAHFDLLTDSALVGVEKPDPRIFRIALERFDVAPKDALHLGDVYSTDITGARAAGMRAALIDPHGHYDGAYPDVPRVPGAVEVACSLAQLT
jgi:putative hydrolase of the HAD superfamily